MRRRCINCRYSKRKTLPFGEVVTGFRALPELHYRRGQIREIIRLPSDYHHQNGCALHRWRPWWRTNRIFGNIMAFLLAPSVR